MQVRAQCFDSKGPAAQSRCVLAAAVGFGGAEQGGVPAGPGVEGRCRWDQLAMPPDVPHDYMTIGP